MASASPHLVLSGSGCCQRLRFIVPEGFVWFWSYVYAAYDFVYVVLFNPVLTVGLGYCQKFRGTGEPLIAPQQVARFSAHHCYIASKFAVQAKTRVSC